MTRPSASPSLVAVARDHRDEPVRRERGLLDHDESFSIWRFHIVLMVEREIGAKRRTGGSSGGDYLRSTSTSSSSPSCADLARICNTLVPGRSSWASSLGAWPPPTRSRSR
jgi:hypothetical protein